MTLGHLGWIFLALGIGILIGHWTTLRSQNRKQKTAATPNPTPISAALAPRPTTEEARKQRAEPHCCNRSKQALEQIPALRRVWAHAQTCGCDHLDGPNNDGIYTFTWPLLRTHDPMVERVMNHNPGPIAEESWVSFKIDKNTTVVEEAEIMAALTASHNAINQVARQWREQGKPAVIFKSPYADGQYPQLHFDVRGGDHGLEVLPFGFAREILIRYELHKELQEIARRQAA